MANTYSQIYIQFIFAVKGRESQILESHRERLQQYISGIVRSKEQKLFQLISENFRYVQSFDKDTNSTVEFNTLTLYEKLQLVTDFISGMTDTYAVNLHQKLLGTRMP